MNISNDTIYTVIYNALVNEICHQSEYIKYMVNYKQIEIDELKTEIDSLKEQLVQTVHKLNEKQNELDLFKKESQTVLTVTQLEINKLKQEKILSGNSFNTIASHSEPKNKLFNFKIKFG